MSAIPASAETLKPLKPIRALPIPAFADIAKQANDLLNKDFYHVSAGALEVRSSAPNNVAFKVTGKSSHESKTSGAIEAKYADKANGKPRKRRPPDRTRSLASSKSSFQPLCLEISRLAGQRKDLDIRLFLHPNPAETVALIQYSSRILGVTVTQVWNTANTLDTKIELADNIAKGLKTEGIFNFLPSTQHKGAKFNLYFQQPNFNGRAFFDLLKGPTAHVDAVVGHEGWIAGATAGYDVQKAAVTSYSVAGGFTSPIYTAAITASDNLSVFAASYYHKVNSMVEAGAKATWNSKAGNNVGLEVATKYRLDPVSFTKAKINDRGIAAVSYNVLLRQGVTLGVGASFDTQKLQEATHKVGASLTFVG